MNEEVNLEAMYIIYKKEIDECVAEYEKNLNEAFADGFTKVTIDVFIMMFNLQQRTPFIPPEVVTLILRDLAQKYDVQVIHSAYNPVTAIVRRKSN